MTTMTHKFEIAGLGTAPFKYVGITENMFVAGDDRKPGGTCDFCGMGIRWECHVRSADGREFKVGSDCIAKVGDRGLIDMVKRAVNERRRLQAVARRDAKRIEREDAERDANAAAGHGRHTNFELWRAAEDERQAAAMAESAKRAAVISAQFATVIAGLRSASKRDDDFCSSLATQIEGGDIDLSDRAIGIVCDIVAKQAGRRNSKAYDAASEAVDAIFCQAAIDAASNR